MEEEVKKNDKTALSLSKMMVILGGGNSFIFAKTFIQINGECPKEIVEAIVKEIDDSNKA